MFFNTILRKNGKTRFDQSKGLRNLNIKALCEALEDRLAQTATILELDKWEKAEDKRLSNTLVNA